jgi:hypothetical protein
VELRSPVCQPQAPDDDINEDDSDSDSDSDGVAQSDDDQGQDGHDTTRRSDSLYEAQGLPVGVIVRNRPAPRCPGGACARIAGHTIDRRRALSSTTAPFEGRGAS